MKLLVSFGILFCVGFVYSHENNNEISKYEEVYTLDGYTYFFSGPFKLDWHGANAYCRLRGMHLVDIPTYAEHQRLSILLGKLSNTVYPEKQFWTSGSDISREGNFVWMSSGHPLTYTNWFTGQPDNYQWAIPNVTENCLELRLQDTIQWNDHACFVPKFFICRNKIINPFLLRPSPECS